jgi:hypothetical protein
MKPMFLFILIILVAVMVAVPVAAPAQDDEFKISGAFGVTGIGASQVSNDPAKVNEYRDLSDGAIGSFTLRGRSKRFYLDAYGENIGRDGAYVDIKGGRYDQVRFSLYGDWLTHSFGFGPNGARTPYSNPLSSNLILFSTDPVVLKNSTVPGWSSFKFDNKRRNAGGTVEFSLASPWYFLLDTNEVSQSGINKVDAAALGTSPGNGFADLPYPLDYKTRNVSIELGYQKPRGHVSLNWLQSNFNNENVLLYFQNPFFGFGKDTVTFAPDNEYSRVSANGMLRQLFWNSTLSARATYDKVRDSQDMIGSVLNTAGSNALTETKPSEPTYKGDVANTTAHVSFASVPARRLDTRIYYNFYKRRNRSTRIEFETTTSGLACLAPSTTSAVNLSVFCEAEHYGYTKNNPGLEAGYRLTSGNRLSAGYDYLDTKRNRFDAEKTRENKTFVQWSNTSFDALTMRVKYQFLDRNSDFLTDNAGFSANDQFYLERFNRSFDVANLHQHIIKAYLDWSPISLLDFGFEAYYKRNTYKNLTLGRMNDRRKEYYGSISYGKPSAFQVTLFGDIEFINYNSFHRTINATPCPTSAPNCFDPSTAPTTTAFNWSGKLHDKNWTTELAADWPVDEKLIFKLSGIIQETRGGVDFQSQTYSDGTPAALLFPINAYDNTKRRSINPRAVYLIARQTELTVGYAFEKYEYRDDQYTGYQYTIGSGTTMSYLSGIYAFPDYRMHVGYATVRYLF